MTNGVDFHAMEQNLDNLQTLKGLSLPIIAPKELPNNFSLERVVPLPDHGVADGYEIELRSEGAQLRLKAMASQPDYHRKGSKSERHCYVHGGSPTGRFLVRSMSSAISQIFT